MRRRTFSPFSGRGRRAVLAILLTFTLSSAVTVVLSIVATSRGRHQASLIEVAARQRTLTERYVSDILLVRGGAEADPDATADILRSSVGVLLKGGMAPPVEGDDDDTPVPAAPGRTVRAQLEQ